MHFGLLAFGLVVNDALQIEDEHLRQLVEEGPLEDPVDLALALLAEIACDFFSLGELAQTLGESVMIFDLQGEAVVVL